MYNVSKHYCNLITSFNCCQVANCSSVAKMARERIYCQTDGFDFLPSAKTTLSEEILFLFSIAVNLTYPFVVSLAVDIPPFQVPECDCEFCVLFHSSYTDNSLFHL